MQHVFLNFDEIIFAQHTDWMFFNSIVSTKDDVSGKCLGQVKL